MLLSSALLGAGGADSAPAVPTLAPAVTGNFTYSEAKALGIPTLPTPNELGLPLCRPNPDWQGFASPQEAELALRLAGADERGPECAVDPRQVIYSVRGPLAARPVPYQSGQQATYRHLGARTDAFGYYGSRITVEVSNPSVGHFASPSEFVSSRPLLSNGSNWIEGGWAEVSWMPDARYVYTYLGSGFDWYFHTQFPSERWVVLHLSNAFDLRRQHVRRNLVGRDVDGAAPESNDAALSRHGWMQSGAIHRGVF